MDIIRYLLAVLVVATFPGAIVFWLLLHSFLPIWRRIGPVRSYLIFASVMVLIAALIYGIRAPIFAVEFGANVWTIVAAMLSYGIAVFIEVRCRKHLSLSTLIGLPELSPSSQNQRLLQDGIYGRLRHPRYVAILFGILAVALLTNYLASYVLVVVFCLGIHWITVLEERELVERFGEAYEEYRSRVPRFIPGTRW